jgi:hypothetical protein
MSTLQTLYIKHPQNVALHPHNIHNMHTISTQHNTPSTQHSQRKEIPQNIEKWHQYMFMISIRQSSHKIVDLKSVYAYVLKLFVVSSYNTSILCKCCLIEVHCPEKSLKIPKRESESVNRRKTDNTMAKRQKDKQQSTNHTHKLQIE